MRLFRPLLLAALAAAPFLATPASAQIREGLYDVQGTNPDGSTYEGQFSLQAGPAASWVGTWQVGDFRMMGMGLIQGGVLALSYVVQGRPGISVYEVRSDGKLGGTWTTGGGLGTEVLSPR